MCSPSAAQSATRAPKTVALSSVFIISNLFFRPQFSRLILQHNGNPIADREGKPVSLANQFILGFSV
jgi:hypothetical protein